MMSRNFAIKLVAFHNALPFVFTSRDFFFFFFILLAPSLRYMDGTFAVSRSMQTDQRVYDLNRLEKFYSKSRMYSQWYVISRLASPCCCLLWGGEN